MQLIDKKIVHLFIGTVLGLMLAFAATQPRADQHVETYLLRGFANLDDAYYLRQQNPLSTCHCGYSINEVSFGPGTGFYRDVIDRQQEGHTAILDLYTSYSFTFPPMLIIPGESLVISGEVVLSGLTRYDRGNYDLTIYISEYPRFRLDEVTTVELGVIELPEAEVQDMNGPVSVRSGTANRLFDEEIPLPSSYRRGFTLGIGHGHAVQNVLVSWDYTYVEIPTGLPDTRVGTDANNPQCTLATPYTEAELTGLIDDLTEFETYSVAQITAITPVIDAPDTYLLPFSLNGRIATITKEELRIFAPEIKEIATRGGYIDQTQASFLAFGQQLVAGFLSNTPDAQSALDGMINDQVVQRAEQVLTPISAKERLKQQAILAEHHADLARSRDMAAQLVAERERVRHYAQTGEVICQDNP